MRNILHFLISTGTTFSSLSCTDSTFVNTLQKISEHSTNLAASASLTETIIKSIISISTGILSAFLVNLFNKKRNKSLNDISNKLNQIKSKLDR